MESIVAHTQRNRRRSRKSDGVVAHDPRSSDWILKDSVGGPIFFVDRIARPEEVSAGTPVDIEVELVNAAAFIAQTDPDFCEAASHGFEYRVTVDPEWTSDEQRSDCLTIFGNRDTKSFSFDAPSPTSTTTYDIDVTVEMVGSGNRNTTTLSTVVIGTGEDDSDDGGRVDPTDPTDPGGDGGDNDGIQLPSGGGLIGTPTAIALGSGLTFLLVVLIATR
jgi:hypothetical protein